MKIQKLVFLVILATTISCNKAVKKDESVSVDKKPTVKKYSITTLTIDNKKICNYYFDESQKLVKSQEFSSNGKSYQEINLEYKNGKFDYAFSGSDKNERHDWSSNYYSNVELYNDFLITKNIKIDNPFMLSSEVSDIEKLITIIESFQKINRNDKTIFKSKKLNLNIRFDPSKITLFIPTNSIITSFEYTTDKNGYLTEEAIAFNDGILTIKFHYQNQKINTVIYSLKYNNGEMLISNQNYTYFKIIS